MKECTRNIRPQVVSFKFLYISIYFYFPEEEETQITYVYIIPSCFLIFLLCGHLSFTNKKWNIYLVFSICIIVKCFWNFISKLYSFQLRRSNYNLLVSNYWEDLLRWNSFCIQEIVIFTVKQCNTKES